MMLCQLILASWKYFSISKIMLIDRQHERMIQRKAKLGLNIFEKVTDHSALLTGWQCANTFHHYLNTNIRDKQKTAYMGHMFSCQLPLEYLVSICW